MEHPNLTCNFTFSADFPSAKGDASSKKNNLAISSLRFCETGENLGVADSSGRVLVLHRDSGLRADFYTSKSKSLSCNKVVSRKEKPVKKMRWIPRRSAKSVLLTTDGSLVHLWKVGEQRITSIYETNEDHWKCCLSSVLDKLGMAAQSEGSDHVFSAVRRQINGLTRPVGDMPAHEVLAHLSKAHKGFLEGKNGLMCNGVRDEPATRENGNGTHVGRAGTEPGVPENEEHGRLLKIPSETEKEAHDLTPSRLPPRGSHLGDKLDIDGVIQQLHSVQNTLRVPRVRSGKRRVAVHGETVYRNAINQGDIHSISVSASGLGYITSDKLTVNYHSIEVPESSKVLLDLERMAPSGSYDSTLWLTCCEMHPEQEPVILYGDSAGVVRMADLRVSSDFRNPMSVFGEESALVIASVASLSFSPTSSEQFAVRDYMELRVYDIRRADEPLRCHKVHEHIRRRFNEFCRSGQIYDDFSCGFSGNGQYLCTGSYSHSLRVFDNTSGLNITACTPLAPNETQADANAPRPLKVLACHPSENMVAVADGRRLHLCDVGDVEDMSETVSSTSCASEH